MVGQLKKIILIPSKHRWSNIIIPWHFKHIHTYKHSSTIHPPLWNSLVKYPEDVQVTWCVMCSRCWWLGGGQTLTAPWGTSPPNSQPTHRRATRRGAEPRWSCASVAIKRQSANKRPAQTLSSCQTLHTALRREDGLAKGFGEEYQILFFSMRFLTYACM